MIQKREWGRSVMKGYLFHSSGIGKGFGNLSFRSVRTWIIESLSIIHG